VKNAVNGQGVAGVNLTFTSGPNVGKSVVTGVDGSYTFSSLLQVPLGTLEASKQGFEGFSDTFAVKDRLPRFDVMLAPAMALGSLRFVLAWGSKPNDLDIHLTTPNAACKVSYQNKVCRDAR